MCLDLNLPPLFWCLLKDGPTCLVDASTHHLLCLFKAVDLHFANSLTFILHATQDEFDVLELTYTTQNSCAVKKDICEGGSQIHVAYEDRHAYVKAALQLRLHESTLQYDAMRTGLLSVLVGSGSGVDDNSSVLQLLSWSELSQLVCGEVEIDIARWQEQTVYKNRTADSPVIKHFWTVIEEFTQQDRARSITHPCRWYMHEAD